MALDSYYHVALLQTQASHIIYSPIAARQGRIKALHEATSSPPQAHVQHLAIPYHKHVPPKNSVAP